MEEIGDGKSFKRSHACQLALKKETRPAGGSGRVRGSERLPGMLSSNIGLSLNKLSQVHLDGPNCSRFATASRMPPVPALSISSSGRGRLNTTTSRQDDINACRDRNKFKIGNTVEVEAIIELIRCLAISVSVNHLGITHSNFSSLRALRCH